MRLRRFVGGFGRGMRWPRGSEETIERTREKERSRSSRRGWVCDDVRLCVGTNGPHHSICSSIYFRYRGTGPPTPPLLLPIGAEATTATIGLAACYNLMHSSYLPYLLTYLPTTLHIPLILFPGVGHHTPMDRALLFLLWGSSDDATDVGDEEEEKKLFLTADCGDREKEARIMEKDAKIGTDCPPLVG